MDLLKSLVGPAILSTIIPLIVSMLQNRKNNSLSYIKGERMDWREKIREISKAIEKCEYGGEDEKCISEYLVQLQMNINSYGKFQKYEYSCDGHIWDTMHALQSSKNKEEFENSKELLLFYLSLMLKSDWERSKHEIRGFSPLELSLALFSIMIFITAVSLNFFFDWNSVWSFVLMIFILLGGVAVLYWFNIEELYDLNKNTTVLSLKKIVKKEKKIHRSYGIITTVAIFIIILSMIGISIGGTKSIINTMRYFEKKEVVELYTSMKLENFPQVVTELEGVFNKDIILVDRKDKMESINKLEKEQIERIENVVKERMVTLAVIIQVIGEVTLVGCMYLYGEPKLREKKLMNTIEEQKDILFKPHSGKLNEVFNILNKILELKEGNIEDKKKIEIYDKYLALEYKNLNELEKVLKKEIAREAQSVETIEQLETITWKQKNLEIISGCIKLLKKKKNWKKVSKIEDGVKKLKEELEELQNNTQNS